jgi:ribosome-associated protein
MVQVTETLQLDDSELLFTFIRSSGPGGQNVNKVATAAQLRFDAVNSPSLPEDVRERLLKLAGKRLSEHGLIIITAKRYRSQERNRQDAIRRLVSLIQKAAMTPKRRVATKPSKQAVERRLRHKQHRSKIKVTRKRDPDPDQ